MEKLWHWNVQSFLWVFPIFWCMQVWVSTIVCCILGANAWTSGTKVLLVARVTGAPCRVVGTAESLFCGCKEPTISTQTYLKRANLKNKGFELVLTNY